MARKEFKEGQLFDERFQVLIDRDYRELKALDPEISPKSVLMLSGSIIEGVLSDSLLATSQWTFAQIKKMSFDDIISKAKDAKIVRKTELSTVLRNYRNLAHPIVEIRDQIEFDDADATLAQSGVEVILREVSKWSGYYRILSNLSKEERTFLNLFKYDKPDNSAFDHPWLEWEVYGALPILERKGILVRSPEIKNGKDTIEGISVKPEAVRYVQDIAIKGPLARHSVNLSFSNIAANNTPGSGAIGSSR